MFREFLRSVLMCEYHKLRTESINRILTSFQFIILRITIKFSFQCCWIQIGYTDHDLPCTKISNSLSFRVRHWLLSVGRTFSHRYDYFSYSSVTAKILTLSKLIMIASRDIDKPLWYMIYDVTWRDIWYDIFINCSWVDTRWQYTFTHKQYVYIEQHK
jgi:hypothetical protein